MWLFLGLISALLLGSYDICKKISLKNNAVIPVLWTSILISSLILSSFLIVSRAAPDVLKDSLFFVPEIDLKAHLFIFIKSIIVLISWILAYFALKNLPLTVVTPIRSTQPIWTVVGGVLIFGEQLSALQITGVSITLFSFMMFSLVGKKEGISFTRNKWIWFIILATFAGTASALYDKFLIQQYNYMAVLTYYTLYQSIVMGIVTLLLWYPNRAKTTPFRFKWSIALISVFLISADFIYFYALSLPGSLISVLSPIRRSGVVLPFLYGAIVMRDKNIKQKAFCLAGILLGILLLFL